MKKIKILLTIAAFIIAIGVSAQWTDNGTYSFTNDKVAIGYTTDPNTLTLTVNGFGYFNGGVFCKALRPGSPDGRFEFGYGSTGGANIEMYKSNHGTRPGDLNFIYGGGDFGNMKFSHYNGSTWKTSMFINKAGLIGIGTENPTDELTVNGSVYADSLSVNGKIVAKEVEVTLDGWADYVFQDNYKLRSLGELEKYIKKHKHLPGIPSEKEVVEQGLNVGEMNQKMLEKIEELSLYVIELQKEIEQLKSKN